MNMKQTVILSIGLLLAFCVQPGRGATNGFSTEWMVLGPFDNPQTGTRAERPPEGFTKAYPPEKEINLNQVYADKYGLLWWRYLPPAGADKMVDFDKIFFPNDDVVAYATTEIYSPDEKEVTLKAGSDDSLKLWLNKEKIIDFFAIGGRPAAPDQHVLKIKLHKGWNRFLVKVEELKGGWGFYFSLEPAAGLECKANRGLKKTLLIGGASQWYEKELISLGMPGPDKIYTLEEVMSSGLLGSDLSAYRLIVISGCSLDDRSKAFLTKYVEGGGSLILEGTSVGEEVLLGFKVSPAAKDLPLGYPTNIDPLSKSKYHSVGLPGGAAFFPLEQHVSGNARVIVNMSGTPAGLYREYGKGKIIYTGFSLGKHLDDLGDFAPDAKGIINGWCRAMLFGKEAVLQTRETSELSSGLNVKKMEEALKGEGIYIEKDAAKLTGTKIAVFYQKDFPALAMPAGVTGEYIKSVLEEKGYGVDILSARDICDPEILTPQNYRLIIMAHGEAYPVDCLKTMKKYLSGGGGLINPAGLPFACPAVYNEKLGKWMLAVDTVEGYKDSLTRFVIYPIDPYEKLKGLLPIIRYLKADKPLSFSLKLNKDYLPHLPDVWPLTGGDLEFTPNWARSYVSARFGFSLDVVSPLAVSVSADGEVQTMPLWFNNIERPYTCARLLLVGYRGESHPWNPKAWPYAREAIGDMVDLVYRVAHPVVKDLVSDLPCYEKDAKEVRIKVWTSCIQEIPGRLETVIREANTGKEVFRETREISVKGMETFYDEDNVPLTKAKTGLWCRVEGNKSVFVWKSPEFHDFLYDVKATFNGKQGESHSLWTVFYIFDGKAASRGPDFRIKEHIPYINGRPGWLIGCGAGSVLDLRSAQGYGGYFGWKSPECFHPVLERIAEQTEYLKALGGNIVRRENFLAYDSFPASLDAAMLSVAGQGLIGEYLFTNGGALDYRGNGGIHYFDYLCGLRPIVWGYERADEEGVWEGDMRWFGEVARRYKDFSNLTFDMANEPHFSGRGESGEFLRNLENRGKVRSKISLYFRDLKDAIRKGSGREPIVGVGYSSSARSPFYDPKVKENLATLDWISTHVPVQIFLNDHDLWNPRFCANYAYPCYAEEEYAASPSYCAILLHSLFAENAIGCCFFDETPSIDVYSEKTMPDCWKQEGIVQSGINRTENTAVKEIKHWITEARLLRITDYSRPKILLLSSPDQTLKEAQPDQGSMGGLSLDPVKKLNELYHSLLISRRIHTRITSEDELPLIAQKDIAMIVIPAFLSIREDTEKRLEELHKAGVKMFIETYPALQEEAVFKERAFTEKTHIWEQLAPAVKILQGNIRYVYDLPKQEGAKGRTIVLMDGSGAVEIDTGEHRVNLCVGDGEAAVLDFDEEGNLLLAKGKGNIEIDGKAVVKAPQNTGYVVGTKDRSPITSGRDLVIDADNQQDVEVVGITPANSLRLLKEIRIVVPERDEDYLKTAQNIGAYLEKQGVKTEIVKGMPKKKSGNLLALGNPEENELTAELYQRDKKLTPSFILSRDQRLLQYRDYQRRHPYSGMILDIANPYDRDKRLILVAGLGKVGTILAGKKFTTLSLLDSYNTGPFMKMEE